MQIIKEGKVYKKKILFILPSLAGGGAERVIVTLLNNLDRKKFDLTLVLFQKSGAYLKQLNEDVTLVDLKCKRIRSSFPKILSMLRSQNPDIIFVSLLPFAAYFAVLKFILPRKFKLIFRETTNVGLHYPKWITNNILGRKLIGWIYSNYNYIICQSQFMYNEINSNYSLKNSNLIVINNPLSVSVENLSRINHVRSERSSIKLISVGRLSFEKGYDVLLHAIKILLDKGLSIECNILGVGNEEISLKNIVRDLGLIDKVNFLGFIEDPKEFILASDYFVFSSRYDGFPNAVLESLACGIPIIALNSPGGISEIIQHRRNGWLINELSEQGLAQGIECAINFKWDKGAVIESARRYDLPFILSKYEYIFDSVV